MKRFPDGEIYVRLPEKPKGKVYYIQSFFPDQNSSLMEAFLIFLKKEGVYREWGIEIINRNAAPVLREMGAKLRKSLR